MFDKIDEYIEQASILYSVLDSAYEGGDFCAGLTVGYEGRLLAQQLISNTMLNMFGDEVVTTVTETETIEHVPRHRPRH